MIIMIITKSLFNVGYIVTYVIKAIIGSLS